MKYLPRCREFSKEMEKVEDRMYQNETEKAELECLIKEARESAEVKPPLCVAQFNTHTPPPLCGNLIMA